MYHQAADTDLDLDWVQGEENNVMIGARFARRDKDRDTEEEMEWSASWKESFISSTQSNSALSDKAFLEILSMQFLNTFILCDLLKMIKTSTELNPPQTRWIKCWKHMFD